MAEKSFNERTEPEIVALAIQLEEEDSRVCGDFAEGLREKWPATAKSFEEMQARRSRGTGRGSSRCTASGSASTFPALLRAGAFQKSIRRFHAKAAGRSG
jgi:hypothetical protein